MGNSHSDGSLNGLQPVSTCVTERFMGTWFVIGVKPTFLEKTCSNAVEKYSRLPTSTATDVRIDIDFTFNQKEPLTSAVKSLPQKGWVQGSDPEHSGLWKISPFWPVKLPYVILEVDEENYSYTVIGYPPRTYVWIMARTPQMSPETYEMLTKRLVEKHKYNLDGLRRVPQVWTAEERTKRGLTAKEIPDSMLENNQ